MGQVKFFLSCQQSPLDRQDAETYFHFGVVSRLSFSVDFGHGGPKAKVEVHHRHAVERGAHRSPREQSPPSDVQRWGYKVSPRLRESHLLAPFGRGAQVHAT